MDGNIKIYSYANENDINKEFKEEELTSLVIQDELDKDYEEDELNIVSINNDKNHYKFTHNKKINYYEDNNGNIEIYNYKNDNLICKGKFRKKNVYPITTLFKENEKIDIQIPTDIKNTKKKIGLIIKFNTDQELACVNFFVIINNKKEIRNCHEIMSEYVFIPTLLTVKELQNLSLYYQLEKGYIDSISCKIVLLDDYEVYSYDLFNRLTYENVNGNISRYLTFNENDLPLIKEETLINGKVIRTNYAYDEYNRITYIEDSNLDVQEYIYDDKGNVVKSRSYNKLDASLSKCEKITYDENGNVINTLAKIKNKEGKYEQNTLDLSNNNVVEVKNSKGSIFYNYDFNNDSLLAISTSLDGINNANTFQYKYELLTQVSNQGIVYNYVYDAQNRVKEIDLNNEKLLTYEYVDKSKDEDNSSIKINYVKEDRSVKSIYNASSLLIKQECVYKKETLNNNYTYNDDNQLIEVVSLLNNQQTNKSIYTYENELLVSKENENVYKIDYSYDEFDKLSSEQYAFNNDKYSIDYEYDDNDLISLMSLDPLKIMYNYDSLKRVNHQDISLNNIKLCQDYQYLKQDENSLDLISEVKTRIISKGNYLLDVNKYYYDEEENIIKIELDDNIIKYNYDGLNRLIREDNIKEDSTIIYTYDNNNNLLQKKIYQYQEDKLISEPKKVIDYVYDYDGDKNRLISYNGELITYDNANRPIKYLGHTLSWNNLINRLNSYDDIQFIYDGLSRRIEKRTNNDVYKYIYDDNNKLLRLIKNNKITLTFKYALNKLIGFVYNEDGFKKEYLYLKNIQDDILGIIDENGNIISEYAYDSYGNIIQKKQSELDNHNLTNLNPFRYRSYYYDEETNLYYLISRYYDSETGRFISPDSIDYLKPDSIVGLNLYAYCENNPVMYVDPNGCFGIVATIVFGTFIGAALGFVSDVGKQLINNGWDFKKINLGSAINSAIVGGALGLSLSLGVAYLGPVLAGAAGASSNAALIAFGASTTVSFAAGSLGYSIEELMNKRKPSFGRAIFNGVMVALESIVNFGVGGLIGSIGKIGTKGEKTLSKEWLGKQLLGQEFTQPFKILINLLRKNIW